MSISIQEARDQIWEAVLAAGGSAGHCAARLGSQVWIVNSDRDYVEYIDLEDTQGPSVSRYTPNHLPVLLRMVRHTLAFDAYRRADPSLRGAEEFWRTHP